MRKIFKRSGAAWMVAVLLVVLASSAPLFAQANYGIEVAAGWAKGNWKFDLVVREAPGTQIYLYVNDGDSYQATVNRQGWATFGEVDLSGSPVQTATDGKLSFTRVANGRQKPINYTQRYYATSNKVSFSALYVHPTTDISGIQSGCDSASDPSVILTITNHSSHDMAYDITVGTFNSAGKQVGSEEGIFTLTAGQYLPYQSLFGSTTGTCGATAKLTRVNAYDDTNDNGQPTF